MAPPASLPVATPGALRRRRRAATAASMAATVAPRPSSMALLTVAVSCWRLGAAALAACPHGYFQDEMIVWRCSGAEEDARFLLGPNWTSPTVNIPKGVGHLKFHARSSEHIPVMLVDSADKTIVDGETGGIVSVFHPSGKYKGMDIHCDSEQLQEPLDKVCKIEQETMTPLVLRFDNPFGATRDSLVMLSVSYVDIEPCPEVMEGCAPWDDKTAAIAEEQVEAWAEWARGKFGGAEQAWNALADKYAFRSQSSSGTEGLPDREVPLFAWEAVWREYRPDNRHAFIAFHAFDADHDLRISREEFTLVYVVALEHASQKKRSAPQESPKEPEGQQHKPATDADSGGATTGSGDGGQPSGGTTGAGSGAKTGSGDGGQPSDGTTGAGSGANTGSGDGGEPSGGTTGAGSGANTGSGDGGEPSGGTTGAGSGANTGSGGVAPSPGAKTGAGSGGVGQKSDDSDEEKESSDEAAAKAAAEATKNGDHLDGVPEVVGEIRVKDVSLGEYMSPGPTQAMLKQAWAEAVAKACGLSAFDVRTHFAPADEYGLLIFYRATSANSQGLSAEDIVSKLEHTDGNEVLGTAAKVIKFAPLPDDVRQSGQTMKYVASSDPAIVGGMSEESRAAQQERLQVAHAAQEALEQGAEEAEEASAAGVGTEQMMIWIAVGLGLLMWICCSCAVLYVCRGSGGGASEATGGPASANYRELIMKKVDEEQGLLAKGSGAGNGRLGPHAETFEKLRSNDSAKRAIEDHRSSWQFHHSRLLGYQDRLEDGFRALFSDELLLVDSRKGTDGRPMDPSLRGFVSFLQSCLPPSDGRFGPTATRVAVVAKSISTGFGGTKHQAHNDLDSKWRQRFEELGLRFPADVPIGLLLGRQGWAGGGSLPGSSASLPLSTASLGGQLRPHHSRGAGLQRHRAILFKYVCDALRVCDAAVVWDARNSSAVAVALIDGKPLSVDLIDEPGSMEDAHELHELILRQQGQQPPHHLASR